MFTGLVQDLGTITRLERGGMLDLWIRTSLAASSFARGESIAIDGTCLTVVETRGDEFKVQASEETLRRTTLSRIQAGANVNLERALQLSDRLGGHLVLGHVDAVGEVLSRGSEGDALLLAFSLPSQLSPFFIEKGSVAVDGVSLTVNDLFEDRFTVALIPETQARTTLGKKAAGDRVNLEADLIGKYVARLHGLRQAAGQTPGGLTAGVLAAAGFGGRTG
jgi:riboflavin synthase